MGFISDAVNKVGNVFGFGGGANQYRAPGDYSAGIAQSQGQALDGSSQQAFIDALRKQAGSYGQGPSVAQALLQQQTQGNNAAAAGQIASARGVNPALMARMAIDRTAQNNQQATGQGALLGAQENLNNQGMQLQTQGLLNNAINTQRGQGAQTLGALGGMQQGINQVNAGVAGQNANISSNAIGGLMGGVGSMLGMSGGGEVPRTFRLDDPMSYIGIDSVPSFGFKPKAPPAAPDAYMSNDPTGGAIADPSILGGGIGGSTLAAGGPVPGKAAVAGDSSKNDTVPAMLSPGEVVLPRSVADDPEKASAFVRAIRRQKEPEGYGKALMRMRGLEQRLKALEGAKMADGGKVEQPNLLSEALRRLFTSPPAPSNSSPSVFDAASAIRAHQQRLQQAAEAK